jgi:16S rRNA (cytosine967-C5)-methyltransferase
MNIRAQAALVIHDVIYKGRSLHDALPEKILECKDVRDHALLQAICFGTCRWFFRLTDIADQLLDKPLKDKDSDVYALILVGLYQLIYMRVPSHAAVAETVAAASRLKKLWAKGLINAVLRNFLRNQAELEIPTSSSAQFSHPLWMIENVKQAYPDHWEDILNANNEHPPFALRVNEQQITRDKYIVKLTEAELKAEPIPLTDSGIILTDPTDVQKLPGFASGEVSVQDGAAQLAASLMMLEPGLRVLDACAAPGGKTAHLLELQPTVKCIAVEYDAQRSKVIHENLKRLNLSAKVIVGDAGAPDKWWDGELFDRILLDAPCSATGVIRRHPDIKLLRRESDIETLAVEQLRLLEAIWPLLKKGGVLLYATCSIFPQENADVVQRFMEGKADVLEEKILQEWGVSCPIGKQILPKMHNMDGFYYARLRKML